MTAIAGRNLGCFTRLRGPFHLPVTQRQVLKLASATAISLAAAEAAFAQVVGQIPERAAGDAFGVSVEGEAIGLYDAENARGASPLEAGNIRIEGLYASIDEPSDRLSDESVVAVGLATLQTTHAAPSGVVDYALRRVEDGEGFVSISASATERWSTEWTADAGRRFNEQISVIGGAGASIVRRDAFGDDDYELDFAAAAHWESERASAAIFTAHEWAWDEEEPIIYIDDNGAPPRVSRRRSFHQPFVGNDAANSLFGASAMLVLEPGLHLRSGVFLQRVSDEGGLFESFEVAEASGAGRRIVTAIAPSNGDTISGELRLEHAFESKAARGVVFVSLRGRSRRHRVGGAAEARLDVNPVPIDLRHVEPRPDFDFESDQREAVDQQLAGLGARALVGDGLEINAGVERSWYEQSARLVDGGPAARGSDRRWLGNIGVAARLSDVIRIYAGYAAGLEELDAAPFTAVNANASLAAAAATQRDAAIEWRPNDKLALMLGAFEIRRPFAGLDEDDVYRVLGEERGRGVEFSGVWRPHEDTTFIAGVVVQDAELAGESFDANTRVPGRPETRVQLDADVAWPGCPGLFLTFTAAHERGVAAHEEGDSTLPPQTTVDLGLRYEFEMHETPMQIELSVSNVADAFFWRVENGDEFLLNEPRTVTLSLSADF